MLNKLHLTFYSVIFLYFQIHGIILFRNYNDVWLQYVVCGFIISLVYNSESRLEKILNYFLEKAYIFVFPLTILGFFYFSYFGITKISVFLITLTSILCCKLLLSNSKYYYAPLTIIALSILIYPDIISVTTIAVLKNVVVYLVTECCLTLGVPIKVIGVKIINSGYILSVDDTCSGYTSFTTAINFVILFTVLFNFKLSSTLLYFSLCMPLIILSNVARIVIIINRTLVDKALNIQKFHDDTGVMMMVLNLTVIATLGYFLNKYVNEKSHC